MLNVKKLQAIRDKILGVTVNAAKYGDLNSVVYLQQILDAVQGITSTPARVQGNLNEKIYLQKIRNAKCGVADGQFGSLSNSIYLQQIINAYNGVADKQFGSLSEETYLDILMTVASTAAVASSLLTGLVAYWPMEEASGNRVDATGRGNDLSPQTPAKTVRVSGQLGYGVSFTDHVVLRRASNADLLVGDDEYTIALWYKSAFANSGILIFKAVGTTYTNTAFILFLDAAAKRLRLYMLDATNTLDNVAISAANSVTGNWDFVVFGHRKTPTNQLFIQVNNAAEVTFNCNRTYVDNAAWNFNIGGEVSNESFDEVGKWSRVLTAAERTTLYNGGVGKTYPF